MPNAAEELSADLAVSGKSAGQSCPATSQPNPSEGRGFAEALPISAVRGLASHADATRRRNAYDAELRLAGDSVPIAAALNSIKGASITLCNHRGWKSPLDVALFHSNIDQATEMRCWAPPKMRSPCCAAT